MKGLQQNFPIALEREENTRSKILEKKINKIIETESEDLSQTDKESSIKDEDPVFKCLKESLKIMEKIQKDFETSSINKNIIEDTNKAITEKDKKLLKIKQDLNITSRPVFPYLAVSEYEKNIINDQIAHSSDHRMKNYSNMFNIINVSLSEVKDCIIQLNKINGKIYFLNRNK